MAARSREEGAAFIALNYPFPGKHHRDFRAAMQRGLRGGTVPILDLYAHFEQRYTREEWQALRTPQDHIDHRGYRAMGEELLRRVRAEGWLH